MPHPQSEVFWQMPTTGNGKMTNAQQMPGEWMGALGIDWTIIGPQSFKNKVDNPVSTQLQLFKRWITLFTG